jgi:proton-coupled amino acid transporter
MTSSAKPVNITSPRLTARELDGTSGSFTGTPAGTPDLRALRAQYVAASTPPPNIPKRTGTPASQTRYVSSSLLPQSDSAPTTPRLVPGGLGGISARRPSTPSSGNEVNPPEIADLPDEEKAKVLRRHLVFREERTPEQERSRKSSVTFVQGDSGLRRQDTDAFPIPYDAPGADVT